MPLNMDSASAWLFTQVHGFAGHEVQYGRDDVSVTILADPSRTEYQIDDQSGGLLSVVSWDWCTPNTISLSGPTMPKKGDIITDGQKVFEVCDIAGQGCWVYEDKFYRELRIHSKMVSDK